MKNHHPSAFSLQPFFFAFFVFFCGYSLLSSVGCHRSAQEKPLRVGMDLSYPPFEMINDHGEPDGISVAIARALSEYLHRPLQIENIPFVGLLPSLQTGKIDLIISSMTDTPERRKSIAFSDPYLTIGLGALVRQDAAINDINDLNRPGITVAVRQGTTGQLWAQKNLPLATLLVFDQEAAAVLEVLQKKVGAFLYDEMSVWKHHHEHPLETRALLSSLQQESWAIGLRLSDVELRDRVNQFLKTFREEKGFERLGDRYLEEQKKGFAQEGVPFVF
ncbi:MAG: transporter substrate-binding domain-containing protein [Chthoniobacterales bacterium]|nr:transporter substrate-binding domain-containing protein [Chthoniobacterales bacterium]